MKKRHPIETLTREALSACENGQWDQVTLLYQRRANEFIFSDLPVEVIRQIIKLDKVIQNRARVVHRAALQSLHETQERRRKLQQWKQQWMPSSTVNPRFVRSA